MGDINKLVTVLALAPVRQMSCFCCVFFDDHTKPLHLIY